MQRLIIIYDEKDRQHTRKEHTAGLLIHFYPSNSSTHLLNGGSPYSFSFMLNSDNGRRYMEHIISS